MNTKVVLALHMLMSTCILVIEVGFRKTTLFLPKSSYLDRLTTVKKNDNMMARFLNINYAFQQLGSIDNTMLNKNP